MICILYEKKRRRDAKVLTMLSLHTLLVAKMENLTVKIRKWRQQNAISPFNHVVMSLPPHKLPSPRQQSHPPPTPPFISRSGGSDYSDCLHPLHGLCYASPKALSHKRN
ncbi:hypothetical protein N665_0487s0019 [Sinapis alba]|nr:hypothetical protein N665_0487s0019 [Sinapis alba]